MVITKLKLDKDRKKILDRKSKAKQKVADKAKGKHRQEDIKAMDTSWVGVAC